MKCPLCPGTAKKIFEAQNIHGRIKVSPEKFLIFQCAHCQLIFPQVKSQGKDYYQKYYGRGYARQGNWLERLIGKISLFFKQRLISQYQKQGNLLDVGCSRGGFLAAMPQVYQKWGIEVDKKSSQFIKQKYPEIKLINSPVERAQLKKGQFEIVTLWHTLEHLSHPQKALKKIYQSLKKGGFLIIETPNTDSLGFKLAQGKWFHLDCPRHLFLFNQKNLINLLKKNKFKVVEIKGNLIDYPLDFYWDLNNYLNFPNWFLKITISLLLLLPSLATRVLFLLKPELSETITLIAKKDKR